MVRAFFFRLIEGVVDFSAKICQWTVKMTKTFKMKDVIIYTHQDAHTKLFSHIYSIFKDER